MTEPVNNQWIELLNGLDKISEYNKLGGRGHGDLADTCYICGISPSILKAAILSKLESIEQEAELYGRLHETIEMFQSGTIASYKYSQRHAELTEQISQLKLGVTT